MGLGSNSGVRRYILVRGSYDTEREGKQRALACLSQMVVLYLNPIEHPTEKN